MENRLLQYLYTIFYSCFFLNCEKTQVHFFIIQILTKLLSIALFELWSDTHNNKLELNTIKSGLYTII